jgi:membrane associated rhomboid family serine protease
MADWLRRSNTEPLFWLGPVPVTVTNLFIGLYIVDFVLLAVCSASGRLSAVASLAFNSGEVFREGQVWQLITYPLIQSLSPWFLLEMLMLYWVGHEIESSIGRKGFLLLYLCLVVTPALALSVIYTFLPATPAIYFGTSVLHFSLFIAFATLMPNVQIFFGILAKWAAIALFAVYTLIALASNNWPQLTVLWTSAMVATFSMKSNWLAGLTDWLEDYKTRQTQARREQRRKIAEFVAHEQEKTIDDILDKISKQGLPSLTIAERATLEKTRLELLKKDKR